MSFCVCVIVLTGAVLPLAVSENASIRGLPSELWFVPSATYSSLFCAGTGEGEGEGERLGDGVAPGEDVVVGATGAAGPFGADGIDAFVVPPPPPPHPASEPATQKTSAIKNGMVASPFRCMREAPRNDY
jgi:hypothetical protein